MKFSTAFFALIPLVAALPPAAVHTEAVANSKVGPTPNTQGNVFVCQDAGFHTNCQVLHGSSGHCVNVPASLNDVISSFGPDSGQDCFIFEDINCGGDSLGPIRSPGISDLLPIGWGDRMSSFKCFFG
ncbi:hypothetical protein C8J57DRAFT_624632 [Mycena rebaudengoi]|nr:hypothetical protein C8J57DRAFT_1731536 [Mycena rebaudengoi]KAJ7253433.1 hypothetical protein C8J57DRAFT_624632 [Mycena rebaudengoi]